MAGPTDRVYPNVDEFQSEFQTLLRTLSIEHLLILLDRGILGGLLAIYGGFVGWLGLLLSRAALQSLAVTGAAVIRFAQGLGLGSIC